MNKIYKIWNKLTKRYDGCYSGDFSMQYDFGSEKEALNSKSKNIFLDDDVHEIHEFEVTQRLVRKLPIQ